MSALAALVDGLVDYAGLFPPAGLGMPEAVAAYARHRAGADAAMLGRFVLPVARLEEFLAARTATAEGRSADSTAASGAPGSPWRLSVLAGAADGETLDRWNARHGAIARIDTVEAKAGSTEAVAALGASLASRFTVYVELPVRSDPSALVAAVGAHGMRAKIRTGGVTADAFPEPQEVLRFLRACHASRVPFKATAGLHHPLRGTFPLTYAPDSARATMYGFVNLFLAAVLLHAGAADDTLTELLDERDPGAIVVAADSIRWRGHSATTAQVAAARAAFAGSFGSCSFDEPARELPQLTSSTR